MAIKGRVFVVPNPETNAYELWVQNEGDQEVGVTNNILPPGQPDLVQHDDNGQYGHGLLTRPGTESWQAFQVGGMYHQLKIAPGCHLRVGLRGAAHATVVLPPIDAEPIEIDFKDFIWYGSQTAHGQQLPNMRSYEVAGMTKGVATGSVIARINEMRAKKSKFHCEGEATVSAIEGKGGALSHWEVSFKNGGEQAWIGTCVFEGAEKNDGVGLESMACPDKGSRAVQRIEAMGNYGKSAEVGAMLRLGVRGYASTDLPLPSHGEVTVDLKKFRMDASQSSDEFFDRAEVKKKRQEKMARVQFFNAAGKALNAEMQPVVRVGQEALDRTDFRPPRVQLRAVADSDDTPGGGWLLEVQNRLPPRDEHVGDTPDIGFIATVRLGDLGGDAGWDPQQLPPKRFESDGESKNWFIPADANVNGVVAAAGEVLVVGTRGLGWYCHLKLPKGRKVVDTDADVNLWSFREDQFTRRSLRREFTSRCRN